MFHKIDLSKNVESASLYARMTWQVLFDCYRGQHDLGKLGSLDDMDSLLCDLEAIKEKMGKFLLLGRAEFWWDFVGGWTEIRNYDLGPGSIRIVAEGKTISFYEVKE